MLPSGNDAATALAEWGGKQLIRHHLTIQTNISHSMNFGNE